MLHLHPTSRTAARSNPSSTKSGSILVQAALLLFGLMALSALIVDLGIARVTQGGMKVAADSACLAGLRNRDANAGSPAQRDRARRLIASQTASGLFDEDLDLATANSALLLGAGPQISTGVQGVANPAGGQLVSSGPYLPRLQLNVDTNDVAGDFVAGNFAPNPGSPNWHAETAAYGRTDFLPAAVAESPRAPAFLARMRRSHDPNGLDNLAGISSAGPSLPFLFGLGSPLGATDASVYDPRRDGITVRATSIADARPVVAAGLARTGLSGTVSVGTDTTTSLDRIAAIEDEAWRSSIPVGSAFTVIVRADGEIVGDTATPTLQGFAADTRRLVRVGDPIVATPVAGSLNPAFDPNTVGVLGYFALYSERFGLFRVSGFAGVRVDSAVLSTDPDGQPILTVSGVKLGSLVAPENASAVPSLASDLGALLPPSPDRGALLAPVLVR